MALTRLVPVIIALPIALAVGTAAVRSNAPALQCINVGGQHAVSVSQPQVVTVGDKSISAITAVDPGPKPTSVVPGDARSLVWTEIALGVNPVEAAQEFGPMTKPDGTGSTNPADYGWDCR
jgi:hypothetical protein